MNICFLLSSNYLSSNTNNIMNTITNQVMIGVAIRKILIMIYEIIKNIKNKDK